MRRRAAYSRLAQITEANAARLGLAWSLDLPGEGTLEGTPLAVEACSISPAAMPASMRSTAGRANCCGNMIRRSGNMRTERAECGCSASTAAWPMPMAGSSSPRSTAGCSRSMPRPASCSGRRRTIDPASVYTLVRRAARVQRQGDHRQGGADFGMRGYVTAYDQETGKQLWRFYTAPGSPEENKGDPAMERAAATWSGEYWKTGTGRHRLERHHLRSRAQPHLSSAPATAAPTIRRCAAPATATISTSPRSSRSMPTPANMSGTIR